MQTDPIGYDDGMNWYSYVGNDPVNLNDPTGNSSLLISPKFAPRLTPVARGVRQAINNKQPSQNPVQQQTKQIENQMTDTVKNSKPEVRQPSLKEVPKAPSDTKGGLVSKLIKQVMKHSDDLGVNGSVSVEEPSTENSSQMSTETIKSILMLDALANPAQFSPEQMSASKSEGV